MISSLQIEDSRRLAAGSFNGRPDRSSVPGFWSLQAFGWSLYFAVYGFHMLLFREARGTNLIRMTVAMILGFLISSAVRFRIRRIDLRRSSLGQLTLRILPAAAAAGVMWFWSVRFVTHSILEGPSGFWIWIRQGAALRLIYPMFMDMILFVIWSALYVTIKLWSDWDRERRQAEEARKSFQAHQFQTLCYQMNPHFLFNALNAIRALIAEDKRKAKCLVTDLSEFLRHSLEGGGTGTVALAREIEAVRRYLSIEAVRYEDRLASTVDLDPSAADYPVPAFFLNPLVEGALRQGMRTAGMPLRLSVLARMTGPGDLRVTVRHSGKWSGGGCSWPSDNGEAKVRWVRRILDAAYPGRHRIRFDSDAGGARLQVELFNATDGHYEKNGQGAGGG
ncbi:MAG: histidine kinase [bacterium]|nr:histidine kinase [bacterium]